MAYRKKPIGDRFWPKVQKGEGCWNWIANRAKSGHGQFKLNNAQHQAHRVSWIIHYGAIPDGLWVLHECDNPSCVNPDHLYLGGNRENVTDRVNRKRGNTKLTGDQVSEIRAKAAAGLRGVELAKEYGVTRSMISCIVLMKSRLFV